jgi:5'-methylthioadenosine phosphorylase
MAKIGIIGGSGLDDPALLKDARDESVTTPWGEPSSPLKMGTIDGVSVVLLARHGRQHTIPPSQVNYRANIAALKAAGCTHILATTAVGSLREDIHPGDLVILDQFIDFTRRRDATYFESFAPGSPDHTAMPDPYDAGLRALLIAECRSAGYRFHERGCVLTEEGPRFATRAESRMFRVWGADVVNMSIATETALACEAAIPYAGIAMSTDYDAWRESGETVTWQAVNAVFAQNVAKVTTLLTRVIPRLAGF